MASSIEIEEEAATWLARRDAPGWSPADEAALAQWLEASTAHRVAFVRLDATWQRANRLQALGAGVASGTVPARGAWQLSPFFIGETQRRKEELTVAGKLKDGGANRTQAITTRRMALAASLLVALATGVGIYLSPSDTVYRTPVGGLEAITLTDGSTVTLNTASEIRVALDERERRIDLTYGEVFFDVAKDAARPFVVTAAGQRIVAVGTRFSVRTLEDDTAPVRVIVTEGRVRVGPAGNAATELPPTEVAAGAIARSSASGVLVEKPTREIEEQLSWRRGYLVFRDVPLADAVAEFNRYNTRRLVIEDPALAAMHIGGNFRSTNVEAFVRLLADGFPIRVETRGEEILLSAE